MAKDSIAQPVSIEEHVVNVNGDDIPYLVSGSAGPEIVMVHGAGGTRWEWVESMTSFWRPNHRVLAPDLIGFGDSPRRDMVHSTGYLGEFLATFLESTCSGRVMLVGHSLGGRVILDVALRRPEAVEGLVLISPLGFGELSTVGRALNTGAWWVNRLMGRRQPYPSLEVNLVEPDHKRILEASDASRC